METRLTKLLNIRYPLLQGGMALNSGAALAAAVSNAGAAGIIASGGRDVAWLRKEILLAHSLTQAAFGVNIPLPMRTASELTATCLELKPRFVSFSAGKPRPDTIQQLHEQEILVFSVVPNLRAALGAEQAGVDAIVIEGMESGGHVGEMTTMSLLTDVLPQVSIPIVAAGGLSDGRGLAAALIMGAEGVQIGTAFLLAEECDTHPQAKEAVRQAKGSDVHLVGKYGSRAGVSRGIGEKFFRDYQELEASHPSEQALLDFFSHVNYRTSVLGETESGFMYAGQAIEQLREIRPAAEIVKTYMQQAEQALKRATQFL